MKKYHIELLIGIPFIILLFFIIMTYVKNPEINNLPYYTFRTLLRISVTYLISLGVGLFFGLMAAMNKTASKILIPIFDIGQSIPILGYFPAAVLFLIALFPIAGMEMAAIFLLFTSMEWAIFFGVVGAVKNIPANVVEAAKVFGIKGFNYIRHVVLPAITPAIIAASTLAWGDGWFFMIASEYISYGGKVYALPGLGSYLAKAAYVYNDLGLASVLLVLITSIVVIINHFTWHRLTEKLSASGHRPIFKFPHVEIPHTEKKTSKRQWMHLPRFYFRQKIVFPIKFGKYTKIQRAIGYAFVFILIISFIYFFYHKIPSFKSIKEAILVPEIFNLPFYIFLTMSRLTIAFVISLTIAIVMGILAAENRKFAMIFFPLYDIGQCVPILALFPIVFVYLSQFLGGTLGLEITAIVVLVADMIWYMFLNIVSAIKTIPQETKEVSKMYGLKGWKRIRHVILPSIMPAIVTGSILSWATGWNTVIFAEYMPHGDQVLSLPGLGYLLDKTAYEQGNTIFLIFLLFIIASIVLLMEKFIWRRLLEKCEKYEAIET
jgi:NitT/TauT family transport system permease protein